MTLSSTTPTESEEFALPSEQFGFSDQEIFGIKKPKKSSQKPQSIQDVIGQSATKKQPESQTNNIDVTVKEIDEDVTFEVTSHVTAEANLSAPITSPECQFVKSLELKPQAAINQTNDENQESVIKPVEIIDNVESTIPLVYTDTSRKY